MSYSNTDPAAADLALVNGCVWTGDSGLPWADAVAVSGKKIMAIGSDSHIRDFISRSTRVIDLERKFMIPGLIDGHAHFMEGGFRLTGVNLSRAENPQEFASLLNEKAKELGKDCWIRYGGWDANHFNPPRLPRKDWIDSATEENPVCVSSHDLHMVLVNSLALKMAGITRDTPSPPGGEIVRDPRTGEPTGILKDGAMELVHKLIPPPAEAERRSALSGALRHAGSLGITSVHDMGALECLSTYREMAERRELSVRVCAYLPISEMERMDFRKEIPPEMSNFLKFGGVKGFVDGALGSSTALFFEPYADNPDSVGLLHDQMHPTGIMQKRLVKAGTSGLQAALHAIGDRANRIALDMMEETMMRMENRGMRWRIEHAQHLRREDIKNMGRLGLIASVQPFHLFEDGNWAEKKIGAERARYAFPFRSLIDSGVALVCGSDWPVAPLNPFSGIFAAVTRLTAENRDQPWIPEERISLEEALTGYTGNAAYAEFDEDSKGSISVGKQADLAVLDRNLFEIPSRDIIDTRVVMTIVGGRIVFLQ